MGEALPKPPARPTGALPWRPINRRLHLQRAPGEPPLLDHAATERQALIPQIMTAAIFLAVGGCFLHVALRSVFQVMP